MIESGIRYPQTPLDLYNLPPLVRDVVIEIISKAQTGVALDLVEIELLELAREYVSFFGEIGNTDRV